MAIFINHTGAGGDITLSTDGTSLLVDGTALGGGGNYETISFSSATTYTVTTADVGKMIINLSTFDDITLNLPPAATAAAGFHIHVVSNNLGDITIDPNGTEKIGGLDTYILKGSNSAKVYTDGFKWYIDHATIDSRNGNIAIGSNVNSEQNPESISIGHNANGGGTRSVAIGSTYNSLNNVTASGSNTTAIGFNSSGKGSVAQSGQGATALGGSYACGANSFAAAISDNTSSYGAIGNYSVALGRQAKASGESSFALGYFALATGYYGIAMGYGAQACGGFVTGGDIAIGTFAKSTEVGSTAIGYRAYSGIEGKLAYTSNTFTNSPDGSAQLGLIVLKQQTTTETPATLVSSNNAATMSTPSATNQIILPNNSAYSFSGTIIARQSATDGSDYASWEIKGALLRDGSAATTVLGNGIVDRLYATTGAASWSVALSADTTYGGLKIEVTGAAATNIRWVATVNTSEVTYA